MARLAISLLLAPLATPFAVLIVETALWATGFVRTFSGSYGPVIGSVIIFSLFGLPYAYALAFVLGIPTLALLLWRRWLRLRYFLVAGTIIGVVPLVGSIAYKAAWYGGIAVFALITMQTDGRGLAEMIRQEIDPIVTRGELRLLPIGVMAGAMAAAFVWYVNYREMESDKSNDVKAA